MDEDDEDDETVWDADPRFAGPVRQVLVPLCQPSQEQRNDESQITFDDTLGNSNKENVSVTSSSTVHRWPQLQTLVQHSEYQQVVVKVLAAVDETGATSELKCRNSSDPKGNKKWVKLHDMFFGGDSFRRGLLAGHLPQLAKPSDTKNKIISIWKYVVDRDRAAPDTLLDEIVMYCTRQFREYSDTMTTEKEATKNSKQRLLELNNEMNSYEVSLNGLPPGARGNKGGGRREHSTNLALAQPASYLYANAATATTSIPPTSASASTPVAQGGGRRSPRPDSSSSSTKIHTQAQQDISSLSRNLETLIAGKLLASAADSVTKKRKASADDDDSSIDMDKDTANKLKKLKKKQSLLMAHIKFLKDTGFDKMDAEFKESMQEYRRCTKELIELEGGSED